MEKHFKMRYGGGTERKGGSKEEGGSRESKQSHEDNSSQQATSSPLISSFWNLPAHLSANSV